MPTIYVIAGPNGIGKTTSASDILKDNIPIVNSDEIAKKAKALGLISVNTQEYANHEASLLVDEHLNKRSTFAIETNLADVETWKFLIKVQQLGYELIIKYVSADEINLLNSRISERVLLGDHFVRPDIVKQRYISGLKLLDHYFDYPDIIELFDNSRQMSFVGEFRKGIVSILVDPVEEWVEKYLLRHLNPNKGQRGISTMPINDIDAVRRAYQSLKS